MSKTVNITDKLNYDVNPRIQVGDKEIEVNSDAATMLKIMGVMADSERTGPNEVIAMYELLFGAGEREKIEALKLSFTDFQLLVNTAINLVTWENGRGEQ